MTVHTAAPTGAPVPEPAPEPAQGPAQGRKRMPTWRKLLRNRNIVFGSLLIVLLVMTALFAPWLTPMDPLQQDIWERYAPPQGLFGEDGFNTRYILGADELGRDLLSRLIMGSRVSLMVGLIATGISLLVGVVLGAVAGYLGGWVDNVIMRVMDVLLALPGILLAIAIVAALGPNIVNAMVAIAIVRIPASARIVRSDVLALREEEFVEAARALGVSHLSILFKHILMNAWAPALVLATLGMGTAIVAEAALSFLGLGTQPPQISWGRMLSVGREAIRSAPHVTLYPGLAIMLTVLGFNLLGDGLRDFFDTRLQDR
ncbi:MAG: ABC transporter permease [Deinococcota bacterium]|nr:ABC transporter permease [Deinococcota bacterium]